MASDEKSYIFFVAHWEKNLTWMWNIRNMCGGSAAQIVMNYGFSVIYLDESQQYMNVKISAPQNKLW